MSEEKKEEPASTPSSGGGGGLASKIPLIIGAVNLLATGTLLGTIVYTKILFKRPKITETQVREELETHAKVVKDDGKKTMVNFEPISVNIQPSEQGHSHYASISVSFQLRTEADQGRLTEVKPILMDHILSLFSHATYEQLTSVQGRYVLRSDLAEIANRVAKDTIVTQVFFTKVLVE